MLPVLQERNVGSGGLGYYSVLVMVAIMDPNFGIAVPFGH